MKATDLDRMIEKQRYLTAVITADGLKASAVDALAALQNSDKLGSSFRWLETNRTLKCVLSSDEDTPLGEAATALRRLSEEHGWNLALFENRFETPEFRVAIMDMDSTIINEEVIEELADFAGFREKVTEITTLAMEGKLDFKGALRERVALLKGQPVEILEEVLNNRISATPGFAEMIEGLHARGITTAVVSGGFLPIVKGFVSRYGIKHYQANLLAVADGKLTGEVEGEIVDSAVKLQYLKDLCAQHRCETTEAIAIGDGANDLPMIKAAGLGVAFCAKPIVAAGAGAIVRNRRLDEVLHFLA